jgi:predicted nuclease of predicted toxin-antitoxin system
MLFLADESCDFAAVRSLREAGGDVVTVADAARGAKHPQVMRLARNQGRVLLTEDKDFAASPHSRTQPESPTFFVDRALGTVALEPDLFWLALTGESLLN